MVDRIWSFRICLVFCFYRKNSDFAIWKAQFIYVLLYYSHARQIISKTYWTFPSEIIAAPFVIVAIIGVIVLAILLNRIATFNDCPEAAAELRKQIKQAKEDLSEKGIKFD